MPARRKPKTALRGAVNNIIMESLFDGEKYGYEIIKEVEEKTSGKIKLKQPSLYSSLKRFETKGYIESYWQDSDIGGKRHYYRLTDSGVKYYKKNILKEIEEDIEDIEEVEDIDENALIPPIVEDEEYLEDQIDNYEIDEDDGNNDLSRYEYNVEDKLNSLLGIEESKDEILDELYDELEEETVYSEDDLINDITQEEIVVDHEFTTPTPMSEIIDASDNAFNDIMSDEDDNNDVFADIDLDKTYESKEQSCDELVIEEEPKKEEKAKIYTDEYGITHMYYGDEEPKRNNKVFDNVVLRTQSQDIYSSKSYKNNSHEETILTDEEKELKSKLFFEKFDNKSEQIKREKELLKANEPKKQVEEKIDYNYKSKLNNLFNSAVEEVDEEIDDYIEDESDFNYDEENESYDFQPNIIDENESEDNKNYNMKIFTKEKEKTSYNKYLHINKAKFAFGLTMLIFMLFQVTAMLILFKNKGLLMENQFWVFELSYIIVAVIALIYCIPVFISPNRQASNTFKLGYSFMFGVLAFFIVVILTYAINTFLGMGLFNIKYYIATLVVPIALSLNFIMGPIIYWIISQNKRFY